MATDGEAAEHNAYENLCTRQKEKLNTVFEELVPKITVDYSDTEIQDITGAVVKLLEGGVDRIKQRGIFSISHIQPCGSMAEKTAVWRMTRKFGDMRIPEDFLNKVSELEDSPKERYIEFDFLAVLDDPNNICLEQGCAECFQLRDLPVNLEQLEKHNERIYNYLKNSSHRPSNADVAFSDELSSNFCCKTGPDTRNRVFGWDDLKSPEEEDHVCDKCTVDMPSGKLQVDIAAMEKYLNSAPKDCSLICHWTSKSRSSSTHSDKMFSPETHLMKTEAQVNTECLPMDTELQPVTTEPQKMIIKHHPFNPGIHLMKTEPQTMKNKPWSVGSKHQTNNAEAQTMNNDPRPLHCEQQTMTLGAQTMNMEPRPLSSELQTMTAEAQRIYIEPRLLSSLTQRMNTEPQMMKTEPGSLCYGSQTIKAEPQTMNTEPQTIKADPQAMSTEPQTFKADPQKMNIESQTMNAEPQTIKTDPQTMNTITQTVIADPQVMNTITQTIKADPQTMNTITQTIKADLQTMNTITQTIKADPQTMNIITQTIKAEPKTMSSKPYTLKAEPQTMNFETQPINQLTVFIDFLLALKISNSETTGSAVGKPGASGLESTSTSSEKQPDCFIVPKGCSYCIRNGWRRSGCIAEMETVRKMSSKHRNCYQIMKCLIELINSKIKKQNLDDSVSWYHVKTLLLHHSNSCKDSSEGCAACVLKIFYDLHNAYKSKSLKSFHSQVNLLQTHREHDYERLAPGVLNCVPLLCSVSEDDSCESYLETFTKHLHERIRF